ncbi:unnamed protein product [Cyclocybe aegerita]|uniref:Uncharacterized protein n=1 Tax=Cyclocybe aegerita TaxID=1973307 RepID=A0A8S0VRQ6_CYCAE|nr:unnamed protein product [Cyclocybe aegerita]
MQPPRSRFLFPSNADVVSRRSVPLTSVVYGFWTEWVKVSEKVDWWRWGCFRVCHLKNCAESFNQEAFQSMAPFSFPDTPLLQDFPGYQSYIGTLSVSTAVAFGLVIWDHVLLLPEEKSIFESRKRKQLFSPATCAFMVLRYAAILSTLSGVLYSSVKIDHCQFAISFGNGAAVVVVAASAVILCCRVGALWEFERTPLTFMFLPCIIMVCAWAGVATQFRAVQGFNPPFGSGCQFLSLPRWVPVSYASSATFHCIVFGLAFSRIMTQFTVISTNTGFTLINRACILYLCFPAVGSLILLVIDSIERDVVRRAAAPYLVLIMTASGSRIFLNLQLHNQIIKTVADANHFTRHSWAPSLNAGQVKGDRSQIPPYRREPTFEPSITTISVAPTDARSTKTTTTLTTLPNSLATAPSSFASTSYMSAAPNTPTFSSFAPSSQCERAPSIPETPKRARITSFKSLASSSPKMEGPLKSTWHGI